MNILLGKGLYGERHALKEGADGERLAKHLTELVAHARKQPAAASTEKNSAVCYWQALPEQQPPTAKAQKAQSEKLFC